MERVLRFPTLNRIYRVIQRRAQRDGEARPFADRVLEALNVAVSVPAEHIERVPADGPVVVVANHPFGGIEGLALWSLLHRVRPDVKLIANGMLGVIPELREAIFPVDVFGSADSQRDNANAIRHAMRHLRVGGCVAVFPAGEVSHLRLRQRCITDPPWRPTAARLAQRSNASVCCVHFDGRNSALFQLAGLVHPRLRTVMLPTEMLRRRGATLNARVGGPVHPEQHARFADPRRLNDYLRARTYLLRPPRDRSKPSKPAPTSPVTAAAIAEPVDAAIVAAEVLSLPADQTLLSSGSYDVVFARPGQMDETLHELGRLREWAFRAVGEGTGQPRDLDRFDEHYDHLLLWNRDALRIAGAYRAGRTDELLQRFGVDGLYTGTLFRYRRRLFDRLGPCLELGRSFVHPDEQRGFQPLQLLWKGIGRYVVREPRYRYLLGPVSISAEYASMSKVLLSRFLELHHRLRSKNLPRPKPRQPVRRALPRHLEKRAFSTVVADVDEVNQLVREIESDGKPMPVLLRQYLKLNAKLLGFNLDPAFGDVLDALVLIDLTEVPTPLLTRYLGKDGRPAFLTHHGLSG